MKCTFALEVIQALNYRSNNSSYFWLLNWLPFLAVLFYQTVYMNDGRVKLESEDMALRVAEVQ